MSLYKNMKIRTKLYFTFIFVILSVIILSLFSSSRINEVDSRYIYINEYPSKRANILYQINNDLNDIRRSVGYIGVVSGNTSLINAAKSDMDKIFTQLNDHISAYIQNVNDDLLLNDATRQDLKTGIQNILNYANEYMAKVANVVYENALHDNTDEIVIAATNPDGVTLIQNMKNATEKLLELAVNNVTANAQTSIDQTDQTVMLQWFLMIGIIALIIILATFVSYAITKPINSLVEVSKEIMTGNMDVNINIDRGDEIGALAKTFSSVSSLFKNMIDDLNKMSADHDAGEIDSFVDSNKYVGSFKCVADSLNGMVSSHINTKKSTLKIMSEIANGNFAADLERLPGKKIFINNALDGLRSSLKKLNTEVTSIITQALDGNLSYRVDTNKYQGDWLELMESLNSLMNVVTKPINEASNVLQKMAKGDLDVKMSGDYKGDFAIIKDSMNEMGTEFSSYIKEISEILGAIAHGELRANISRNYVGQFATIRASINRIIDTLNKTLYEIDLASEQVLTGAKQISASSSSLAGGASEQADSIDRLNVSIDNISLQTKTNAEKADSVHKLSGRAMENAQNGNSHMKNMLISMEGIRDSSSNISKIIETINDIAFQTNLLALNAAVEASRAGERGKGFAVVASEVRNLARHSQEAAQETTKLIKEAVERINDGTKIAQDTASALDVIVKNTSEVTELITVISSSSQHQADSISQVSTGLSQISNVVQDNSSTSEESAAAAEELSSQAEALKQLVAFFHLKNNNMHH